MKVQPGFFDLAELQDKLSQLLNALLILNPDNPLACHSRESGNPAKIKVPRSGQNNDVDPLPREFLYQLDSRLRGNDVSGSNGLYGGLSGLKAEINWEIFRVNLAKINDENKKITAELKLCGVARVCKVLFQRQIDNLSDKKIKCQIRDQLSLCCASVTAVKKAR